MVSHHCQEMVANSDKFLAYKDEQAPSLRISGKVSWTSVVALSTIIASLHWFTHRFHHRNSRFTHGLPMENAAVFSTTRRPRRYHCDHRRAAAADHSRGRAMPALPGSKAQGVSLCTWPAIACSGWVNLRGEFRSLSSSVVVSGQW